ncbi:MAG: dihydroneopterin aldolase [Ignavibacteriae bacterium]|nr:dihydroneopterin aldolase [Ignavibacteriota bacterium]MCB9216489.1 dihydroneopterin aldolase [Ignavibacteria bacterium]
MKQTTIRILGAQVYAHHGVGAAEQELGGRYSFDLEMETNISRAAASDNLQDTVDYVAVYEIAHDVIVNTKRRLLESIVAQIAEAVLASFPQILTATIRLRKLRAPIHGVLEAVEVEHRVQREG